MKFYFCDTSAVVKRYHEEKGTVYMDSLFESEANMAISSLTIVETTSAFKKKKNEGKLSEDEFNSLLVNFFSDVVDKFVLLDLDNSYIKSGIDFILKRDIRTLDAFQLSAAVELRKVIGEGELTFVCSDKKLLQAAEKEGFAIEDPEYHEQ